MALPLALVQVGSARAEITYQQILAAPDDLELNLAYARQEVASGRLQQAAAALERLLLHRPNWDAVRLFYGIVLYRLDDLQGAQRELALLEGRGLNPDQEASRLKYLALATRKNKALRITAQVSLGSRFDSNAGRVSDTKAARNVNVDDDADAAVTASSRLRIEHDLGNGRGDLLFATAYGFLADRFDIDRADRISGAFKVGGQFHVDRFQITPYGIYTSAALQYENLRQTYGGGVDLSYSLSSQVAALLSGRQVYENYRQTSFSSIGSARDGTRTAVSGGFRWRVNDAVTITPRIGYARKDAKNNGFSHDSGFVGINAFALLGEGQYVSLTGRYRRTEFDRPDGFYSNTITRRDDDYYARAAYGTPLSVMFSRVGISLPRPIANIVFQLGVTYSVQDSSIERLDVRNLSGDVFLTKRLVF